MTLGTASFLATSSFMIPSLPALTNSTYWKSEPGTLSYVAQQTHSCCAPPPNLQTPACSPAASLLTSTLEFKIQSSSLCTFSIARLLMANPAHSLTVGRHPHKPLYSSTKVRSAKWVRKWPTPSTIRELATSFGQSRFLLPQNSKRWHIRRSNYRG